MPPPTFPDCADAVPLTADTLPKIHEPGLYAAWIDEDGLATAGIEGASPRCAYVGKASNLHARLKRHLVGSFHDLGEILACRGLTLFNWTDRYLPPLKGKMVQATDLSKIATDELRTWQRDHLTWCWITGDREELAAREKATILAAGPLLNRPHGGVVDPRLRYATGFERARARWLWHASWAGLILRPFDIRGKAAYDAWNYRWTSRLLTMNHHRTLNVLVDAKGYPVPRTASQPDAREITIEIPTDKELERCLKAASSTAEPKIQQAIANAGPKEICAWWAAHAGAPHLQQPTTVEAAIAASLRRSPEPVAPCPDQLPQDDAVKALVQLTRSLNTTAD